MPPGHPGSGYAPVDASELQGTPGRPWSPKFGGRLPDAVINRMQQGDAISKVAQAAAQAGAEGAVQGFTSPMAADVVGGVRSWLDKNVNVGPLRTFNSAITHPIMGGIELLDRAVTAAMGAVGGAVTGGAEQAGTEIGGPRLGRDLAALSEYYMTTGEGMNLSPHVSRVEAGPDGIMRDNHIGPVPSPDQANVQAAQVAQAYGLAEFKPAGAAEPLQIRPNTAAGEGGSFRDIGGTNEAPPANVPFEPGGHPPDLPLRDSAAEVIQRLYHEDGILPAEVHHDAQTDPTVLADLALGQKPERYVGNPPEAVPAKPVPVNASVTQRLTALGYDKPTYQRPQNLYSFMRSKGGLQEEAGNLKGIGITSKSAPGLVSKKGMQLDRAREQAVEAGYLPEEATVDDFLQALKDGKQVFSEKDRTAADAWRDYDKLDPDVLEAAHAERGHFDSLRADLEHLGEPDVHSMPDDALQDRLEERLANMEPGDAERFIAGQMTADDARLEAERQKEENAAHERLTGPGNAPAPETAGRTGPEGAGPAEAAGGPAETVNQPGGDARPGPAGSETLGPTRLRLIADNAERTTSGLAESVEASAIQKQLVETFGDLPEMGVAKDVDQGRKSLAFLDKDPESAMAVAMGQKQPPQGVLASAVYVAVTRRAEAAGDLETLRTLGTQSQYLGQARRMGQEISYLRNVGADDTVAAVREVQDAREAALKARDVERETKAAAATVRVARSSKAKLADFINSIPDCK